MKPVCIIVISVFGLLFYGWACFQWGESKWATLNGEYVRGTREFVYAVGQLNSEGRTNEIHQDCQRFWDLPWIGKETDLTNLDILVEDAQNQQGPKTSNQATIKIK
jgi:hypothetical protein